ncbi:restriction endonuclease subunit S [Acidovorax sp.]|uniref:restriction endonuclease subunit S n=1 Tax=Acidovorax sp. TaxID=1872122 RepID=UPI003D0612FD
MSFARYPEYKDSGVEWLGEVPEHWDVKPIKWLSPVLRGASPRPIEDPKYFDDDGEYAWVRIADSTASSGLLKETTQRLSALGSSLSVKLEEGQLFVSIAGTVGKPCITAIKACIHDGFVYFPRLKINPIFLFRVFEAGVCYGGLGKFGTQLNLNTDTIGSIRVAFPPVDEMSQVLAFIDRETAKIDALVAEQEKLIALLQEKRQAVISHAVTKGLDPSVPMKDSGVEWLGEVPAHWEVCALRRVIAAIEQGWSPECYAREAEEQEWGVLKAGCLNGGVFQPSENKALPPEITPDEKYEVRVGDVLMSRASGSPELVGSTALVKSTREQLMLSDKIFRLKLEDFVSTPFFVAALNSRPLRIQIENALSGGNGMASNLPQSSLLTFAITVPPQTEQSAIIDFLGHVVPELEALTSEARSAIALLQERRTALISAAVTGQIDVRRTIHS